MSGHAPLSRGTAIAYGLPAAAFMWVQLLYNHYILKYSVDVLLIPSATMGTILLATRLWDAVSDPLVAYLTDGTRAAAGRRRPWLVGATLPVVLTTFALWNPPAALGVAALTLWMIVAIVLWETAMTTFSLPYYALGAEITMDHHDRTRIAGYRHVFGGIGAFAAIGSVYVLTRASEQREAAFWVALLGLPVVAALMLGSIRRLSEPPEHRDRGARRPLGAASDILHNPHLLWLAAILFFEICGSAAMGVLAPFVCQYVIGSAVLFPVLLLVMQVASYAATPLVVILSRRWGKKRAWGATMLLQATGFLAMLGAGPGDQAWAIACIALVGLGTAGASVPGLSILADTVDYDEYRSGERKEALHYAAVNITRKVAFGSLAMIGGVALQWIGFQPNAEQSEQTVAGLRTLFALLPGGAMLIALVLLATFRLDEREHARIREALDQRAEAEAP
jgi:GPH family glycoside/pentoside/hexuronide:cation symporter